MPNPGKTCPECGAVLSADSPESLCAACLFDVALHDQTAKSDTPSAGAGGPGAGVDPSAPLPPGEVRYFGDYELIEEIGRGGMGVVFKARQVSLKRTVALKMMMAGAFASRDFVQRFYREAEAAARLDHPNIVPIYDIGECEGHHYYTMRLIEGGNLAQALHGQAWPGRRAAQVIVKVARAVHAAHQRGVLHRDVKPANILIDIAGEPFITDFGLAKLRQNQELLIPSEGSAGTPHYMAPEQVRGQADQLGTATDVYGLGVVLYQMLTGRTPFKADTVGEMLQKILQREPPKPRLLRSDLDRDLEIICLRCLQKRPEDRYFFAGALADDLERWLRHEPVQARPVRSTERVWKWMTRRPAMAGLTAVALCSVAALGVGTPIAFWHINAAYQAERLERQRAEFQQQLAEQAVERARQDRDAVAAQRGQVERERTIADEQRILAEQRQRQVLEQRDTVEQNLYVYDLRLAQNAWDQGYASRVQEALDRYPEPKAGAVDPRGFEWHYLYQALAADREMAFNDHPHQPIQGIAWSPQGQWLLTACREDAHLLDARTRSQLMSWPLPPPLAAMSRRGLAFSADGECMAAAGAAGVSFWHRTNDVVLVPSGPCSTVTFAPTGHVVAAGVAWRDGIAAGPSQVRILDLAAYQENTTNLPLIAEFNSEALALAWSQNARSVTAVTPHGTIRMFSLASNAVLRTYRGSNTVTGAAVAPNGRWAARALASGTILVTDLVSGETRATFRETSPLDMHLAFSANSRMLAAAGSGQSIRLWETETWRELPPLRGHYGAVLDVTFGPTEHVLASVGHDHQAHLWRLQDKPTPVYQRGPEKDVEYPQAPIFSPGATRAALATRLDEFVLWNANSQTFKPTHYGRALAFSPDGNRLLVWSPARKALELRDVLNGRTLRSVPLIPPPDSYPSPVISPDGRWLAARRNDGRVVLYEAATGATNRVLPFGAAAWAFNPHGGMLAALAQWSLANTNDTAPRAEAQDAESGLGTSTSVKDVVLFDLSSGQLRSGLSTWSSPSLGFSPDGTMLAVAPEVGAIALLETSTGKRLSVLRGVSSVPLVMAFSPDGQRLATGSLDDAVLLWHLPTGREIASYPVSGPVPALAFSPNGRLLVAGGTGPYRFFEAPGVKLPVYPLTRPTKTSVRTVWELVAR
ncbi:MAG TPA: protein kinase [Verrucomicrobiae bacterium]|nr:protein kinase [Verrucomicrobiae bacterium]